MHILGIHHVAIICSDYGVSRRFYSETLGLKIIRETFREDRDSWKCDLALPDGTQIELFSFPSPPARPSYPEARGLRHLALAVVHLESEVRRLTAAGVNIEPIRTDDLTGKQFTFFPDPDGLPIELYEK